MASLISTIQLSGLGRQTIAALTTRARAQGLSVETYVKELIETDISVSELARRQSIDEVMASSQKRFRDSGMTEAELDQGVDTARTQYHRRLMKTKKA